MIKGIKIAALGLLTIIFLGNCSDKLDAIKLLDVSPTIFLNKVDGTVEKQVISLTDSVRYYDAPGYFYNFKININDEKKNIWKLSYKFAKGEGKVFYDTKELTQNTLRVDLNELLLSVNPRTKGMVQIDFIAQDRFENETTATLNLFVFENLIPEAVLSGHKLAVNAPLEYTLDGTKSFDRDANFNGSVVGYIFQVDGQSIRTTNPTINYIFPTPGTYTIGLKVIDNNGAESIQNEIKLVVN